MAGGKVRGIQRARRRVGWGRLSVSPRCPPTGNVPAYRTTVENSVYVDAECRGLGVADALLGELLKVARGSGFHSVVARIGGGNEASIALHTKHGFKLVGTEREVGRKFGRWQDVTVMQAILDTI